MRQLIRKIRPSTQRFDAFPWFYAIPGFRSLAYGPGLYPNSLFCNTKQMLLAANKEFAINGGRCRIDCFIYGIRRHNFELR
jgi:hypothetical protein